MRKILMLSIVFLFFAGSINAQGVRDDDSYFIYFDWAEPRDDGVNPVGEVKVVGDEILMNAVRTSRGFNVYAKNNSPDADTGAPIMDHSAYPGWYAAKGWDVPDADIIYTAKAPFYLISLDTYQGKWWLFYTQDPNLAGESRGVINIYVPMSGKTNKIKFNGDGTIDIEIEEDGGDWKALWTWGTENVKLQQGHFVIHLDLVAKTGYMAPKQLFTN